MPITNFELELQKVTQKCINRNPEGKTKNKNRERLLYQNVSTTRMKPKLYPSVELNHVFIVSR